MTTLELSSYDPSWRRRFEIERERLIGTLGFMTEGGIIFSALEHVGGSAVPGLAAKPCIDIAVGTEIPLSHDSVAGLAALGYQPVEEALQEGQSFVRLDPAARLYFINASATDFWAQLLVWRDYLKEQPVIKEQYGALKSRLASQSPRFYEEGKVAFIEAHMKAALKWHVATTGFKPLEHLQKEFAALEVPWMVSSGWALDLFLGQPTRYHDDLDITLWYEDQLELQSYLRALGWTLHRAGKEAYSEWKDGDLIEPPHHQVHARRGDDFLDVLLSARENDNWLYRRDSSIKLPLGRVTKTFQEIPYLAPEAVLLYKSVTRNIGPRPKDGRDFKRALPHLSTEAKAWLRHVLEQTNAHHPWLGALN